MSILNRACLMVLLGSFPAVSVNAAETSYSILHSFQGAERYPQASLISDGRGNFYGTTAYGGSWDVGTIFTVRTDGTEFRRLHTFAGGASDGRTPRASLLLDESGNLYGTTNYGGQPGVYNAFGDIIDGAGTVFRIRTDGTGFRLLRAFTIDLTDVAPSPDGEYPAGSLVSDGSGNLFGMTMGGGSASGGTLFRIATSGSSFQILHSFAGNDGWHPVASLVLDRSGNDGLRRLIKFGHRLPHQHGRKRLSGSVRVRGLLERRRSSLGVLDSGWVGLPLRNDDSRRTLVPRHRLQDQTRWHGLPAPAHVHL